MSNITVVDLPYVENAQCYFMALLGRSHLTWLDSGRPGRDEGRLDIIAADPVESLAIDSSNAHQVPDVIRDWLARGKSASEMIFSGGVLGVLSYELGRLWMGLPESTKPRLINDGFIALYDWMVVVDHERRVTQLICQGFSDIAESDWQVLVSQLSASTSCGSPCVNNVGRLTKKGLSIETYREGIHAIKHLIKEGDVYQINFTHRFDAISDYSAEQLYLALRQLSPAPFGAYIDAGSYQLLSNSPEQFLKLQGKDVETKPIKGTRPRGKSIQKDAQVLADLAASDKDRAENLMIVDLLRNDLGRVCIPGSIHVPKLFHVESYATVHHLVSTVSGQLRDGEDAVSLLKACFPGGSITGAPKHRAMQLIDELEQESRELYCGSVVRFGFDGSLDSNITIRSIVKKDDALYYWAGGGIVADSEADNEYQESLDKATAFMRLLED
ncbi:MAG: aminodeoxychorismate synthase component I [Sedimenticolaceae bacterium]